MVHVPEFDGGLVHWTLLVLAVSAPFLAIGEATGWTSFGYSKFANQDRKLSLPSKAGMLIVYGPAVALFWLPALLWSSGEASTPWLIALGVMCSLHFLKRCLESLFVHRYSGVMNLGTVVMICGMYSMAALLFGAIAAREVDAATLSAGAGWPWVGYLGGALWLTGTALNLHHHRLLAKLRKPGETGYKLPKGGLFRWVACPHYLAEILAWWGYALVLQHVGGVVVVSVMTLYLAGRAYNTLTWYRERLGDEVPAGWKRLIPGVY